MSSRSDVRAFTIGFLTAVVLCLALMYAHDVQLTAAIEANAEQVVAAQQEVQRIAAENVVLRAAQREHDETADQASAAAERVTARLGVRIVEVPLPQVGLTGEARTERYVPLSDYLTVKAAWEAERTARLTYQQQTVPGLEAEIGALHVLTVRQAEGLTLRDRRIAHLERRGKLYVLAGLGVGLLVIVAAH